MCSWLRLLSPGPFSAAARFEPGPVVAISLRPRAKERPCFLPNAGPLTKQCPSEGCVCVCGSGEALGLAYGRPLVLRNFLSVLTAPLTETARPSYEVLLQPCPRDPPTPRRPQPEHTCVFRRCGILQALDSLPTTRPIPSLLWGRCPPLYPTRSPIVLGYRSCDATRAGTGGWAAVWPTRPGNLLYYAVNQCVVAGSHSGAICGPFCVGMWPLAPSSCVALTSRGFRQ
jgi:hypothetical protein